MVTWKEISGLLLKQSIDDMDINKGREAKLIDIFSKLEDRVNERGGMIFTETYADIYLAIREGYEAGYEARKAQEKDH